MLIGESQRTNEDAKCLECGHILSGASAVGCDAVPEPGNISICCMCGNIAMFDDELKVRPLTEAEWRIINAQDEIMHMQSLIRGFNEEFGRV